HHPAVPGRVQIDIGPDDRTLGVVPGVGQVIEVVTGDIHVWRILTGRIEPGIDMVVAVPTVEVEAGDQWVAGMQLLHQSIEALQPPDLFQILSGRWGGRRVEARRATIILRAVDRKSTRL